MRPLMLRYSLPLLCVASLVAGVDTAAACGNGKLILEDKFQTIDPSWEFETENGRKNGPDGLSYEIFPDHPDSIGVMNTSVTPDNYEICITFTIKPAKVDGLFGIRFGYANSDDEYWALIYLRQGKYVVNHYVNDDIHSVSPYVINPSLLRIGGAVNDASVSVNGNNGVYSLNGTKVTDFAIEPPKGAGRFGFVMALFKESPVPATFTIKSIQLRAAANAQAAAVPRVGHGVVQGH